MSEAPKIGFLGFGEAAYYIAKGLRGSGIETIAAFDIHAQTPGRAELIARRAEETGTRLVGSNGDLVAACDVILSTVTADQALAAAEQTLPYLSASAGRSDRLYADLNSVSPALKQTIARTVEASGVHFVEVAVMAPVPPRGHRVPILTGGVAAQKFAERMRPFGMCIEIGSAEIGTAAATKMCRSIMIKGLEALLTECVLAATRYNVDERVLASLSESFPGIDWPRLATYMAGRVAIHGERRAREMEEVAETLRAVGVDPMMTEAVVRRMDWSAKLGIKERLGGKDPETYQAFADEVKKLERGQD